MKNTIGIALMLITTTVIHAQEISGVWQGKVTLGKGKEIVFIFDIEEINGELSTTVSIPSQRVEGLKPKQTTFSDGELIVDGSNLGMGYRGKYNDSKNEFEGKFQEGANKIPLTLKRKEGEQVEIEGSGKPQEPKKPYPYLSENVSFENEAANVKLAGTFTKPKEGSKFPAVVLISGSGGQDRDQTVFGHKTFLVLADHLTNQGIAVLRFDDRGFGKSTGDFSTATTADFASDVECAVEYLLTRNDVGEIGLIGHSEGAIIAPMVANRMKKNVAFIVSLAGAGIQGSETSLIVSKNLRPFPVPSEKAYEDAIREAIKIASQRGDIEKIKTELTAHYQKTIAPILRPMLGSKEKTDENIKGLVESRVTPWSRYFYSYNPAEEFKKVKCSVLAINGSKDIQVPADIHLIAIEKALKNGKTKNFKVKELEGLNHFFQKCNSCKMSEYQKLEETFNPAALQAISTWILETVNS
ncbi:alpha/beta hydrolase [Flavobacteriaceae bacterium 3-367]|uniref:alpha/beta hydrolase family protein n=1 Tax=Eudoraea algarum TaxID=3417568 RepID=UPI0032894FA3